MSSDWSESGTTEALEGTVSYPYVVSPDDLAREAGWSENRLLRRLHGKDLIGRGGGRLAVLPEAAREVLVESGRAFPFRVMACANLKGGIGKTTTTLALATRAASLGYRTTVLDLDPQASASLALGVEVGEDDDIFIDIWAKPADHLPDALYQIQPGLYLLPSSLENSLMDHSLSHPSQQKNAVRGVTAALKDEGMDLVILDCPPSLGAATISALSAAHRLIIPVGADAFSFKGLQLTLAELEAIAETFNLPLPQRSVLFSRYDQRETVSRNALERLQRDYPELLAPVPVRNSSIFSKVLEERTTIFYGSRKHPAREDYIAFVRSILE